MPKKTKKEKLLARYHKKLRMLENNQIKIPASDITSIPIVKEEIKTLVIETPRYFFFDLKKSLILIILIVGVEVGLYMAKLIK